MPRQGTPNIVGLIPARAGSKRVKNKNIKPLDATGTSWREVLTDYVEQSGWRIRPQKLLAICAGVGTILAILAALAARRWWIAPLAFLPAGMLPLVYVRFRRAARMRRCLTSSAVQVARIRPRESGGGGPRSCAVEGARRWRKFGVAKRSVDSDAPPTATFYIRRA